MRARHRWTAVIVLALALTVSGFFVPTVASDPFDPTCGTYNNSSAHYLPGYGGYCGGTGGTCSECSAGYYGGYTVCVSDSNGSDICTDYQN